LGPWLFTTREIVKLDGTLYGCLIELKDLKRTIEDEQGRLRPSLLARWLAPLLRRWHHLLAARKPRPTPPSSSGVSDPWID
jgi:hypothetical protein